MKTIKVVLVLTITVVGAMMGVFFVEGITTPIITERLEAEANEALFEMYADADGIENVTLDYPEDDVVSEVFVMKSGSTDVGVVYKAEFAGYNPGILVLLGVDMQTNTIAGFSVLANSETAGIGKDLLADPLFSEQFIGLTIDDLRNTGVDFVSGATAKLTLGGVNRGVKDIAIYHAVNFLGEEAPVEETPDMIKDRLKETWFLGATFTEGDASGNVLEVLEASTGGVFMTAQFTGYGETPTTYVLGFKDGEVLGYATLESSETDGLGLTLITDSLFADQFTNIQAESLLDTGVDYVSGSTAAITLAGINESLIESVGYYVVNYLGGEAPVIEGPMDRYLRLMDEWVGADAESVVADYPANVYVSDLYTDGNGAYFVEAVMTGYSTSESIYILGIKDNEIIGYSMIQTAESPGLGKDLLEDEAFEAQMLGVALEDLIASEVDFVSGSTASLTLNGFNESFTSILSWFQKEVMGIKDTTPPTIEFITGKVVEFEVGSDTPDLTNYVIVTDNEEVALVSNNVDEVDFDVPGNYTVTFTALDVAGNHATLDVTITVVEGEVEFVIISPAENIVAVLALMAPDLNYHNEFLTGTDIQGVFTARNADMEAVYTFYYISTDNGGYSPDNHTMVQFDAETNALVAINVYDGNSSYTTEYATGTGLELKAIDTTLVVDAILANGTVTTADLDSVSGTTADYTFPAFIAGIEEAMDYQTTHEVGGVN